MTQKNIIIMISVALILLVLAITNPKYEQHASLFKSVLMGKIMNKMQNELSDNPFSMLAIPIGERMIDSMMESELRHRYYNILICSFIVRDDGSIITFGIAGNVYKSKELEELDL